MQQITKDAVSYFCDYANLLFNCDIRLLLLGCSDIKFYYIVEVLDADIEKYNPVTYDMGLYAYLELEAAKRDIVLDVDSYKIDRAAAPNVPTSSAKVILYQHLTTREIQKIVNVT